jgi:hypothetical protein
VVGQRFWEDRMSRRTLITRAGVAAACAVALTATAAAASSGLLTAGPRPDGTAIVPVGYRVTPAGQQTPLGDLPLSAVPFPDGAAVLVVNAGQGVQSLQVVDAHDGDIEQSIEYRSPEALFVGAAFSPDGTQAYVSAGGNNKIRVFAALVAGDGHLLVVNAKGLGAGPNDGPAHPNPYAAPDQYPGSMIVGALSRISLPITGRNLRRWTAQVQQNNGFNEHGDVHIRGGSSIVPRRPGDSSPIQHVIYVVQENRTFDQVLGSLGKGNGDASLNLFGDESAPNTRELARRFTTVDNFYANAEVSAQGWNWAVAANSNPYSEQGWPANHSGRNHDYPSESGEPVFNRAIWKSVKGTDSTMPDEVRAWLDANAVADTRRGHPLAQRP